ncbi:hypothetical protein RMSM_02754 [Rhodopirellula maiorica SM1]|uniref:Uncharacterized protein n=1 Tax=Rhodopirellula maiorica SM1 TaxID=1265738 RepID=M5S2C4_9BACT|nr:hypothetical protein [Rhodopirellula maiorica]EMI20319.1 hypothetical protein RMSM_02754 [Rhodopirellula maiorica SM1]
MADVITCELTPSSDEGGDSWMHFVGIPDHRYGRMTRNRPYAIMPTLE